MKRKTKHPGEDRREQAELRVRAGGARAVTASSPEETERLVHELRVHQLELEMQNEELRRAQVGLDASRARYFDLYDLAPVGYCSLSETGIILEANLTAAGLLGLTRAEVVKRPLSRFIFKDDQETFFLCWRRLLQTSEPQRCELRLIREGGVPLWASVAASAAVDPEGLQVHRVMLSDLSARKLLDQRLQDTNAQLEEAKSVAVKASQAKSEFLSSMSHELRSPLNAILGFAQLMEQSAPPPTGLQQESLGQILKAGWYLLELVNEILDLAAVESGRVTLALEPVSLADVLADCHSMIEPQAQKRGLPLFFPALEAPCFISVDRTRLKQVLVNLLSNALKYNKPGGSVTVTVSAGPERVRISVRDTGDGLPVEKVKQLFQSFNRLGRETGPEEGTGIGLMVSKRLVELMGGAIGAQSTPGEGSVFWFELNTAYPPPPSEEGRVPPAAPARASSPGAAPRTVLYVEDNPANMQLVKALVGRRKDLRLVGAPDGQQGIALAREELPQVILMDLNLPGISGLQALKALRADPLTSHIPVLALSANAMPSDVQKGMKAGFLRYLTKPIRIDEFMAALDFALSSPRS